MQADAIDRAKQALSQGLYQEAIHLLEPLSQDPQASDYPQVQMTLLKAYQQANNLAQARKIAETLIHHPETAAWAQKKLEHLIYLESLKHPREPEILTQSDPPRQENRLEETFTVENTADISDPKRSTQLDLSQEKFTPKSGISIPISSTAGSLLWTIVGTCTVLSILYLGSGLGWVLRLPRGSELGILLSVMGNLLTLSFFLTPRLLDWIVSKSYQGSSPWVSLQDLKRYSPSAQALLTQVTSQNTLKLPRLAILPDPRPMVTVYGTWLDGSRILVTEGVFSYLTDPEITSVYAHVLGRILNFDSAVLSLLSTPLQILFAVSLLLDEAPAQKPKSRDMMVQFLYQLRSSLKKISPLLRKVSSLLTYPLFYLCQVGTYYGDHQATELTGDPNLLSRALVKMAHGFLSESKHLKTPPFFLEQTRLLGIYDIHTATGSATAYRATPAQVRQIILWDLFNPWSRWMQVNSSHPLIGKRIRVLSLYAERLRLPTEYDLATQIPLESRQLDRKQLTGKLPQELLFYTVEIIGLLVGWGGGILFFFRRPNYGFWVILGAAMMGFGIGLLVKSFLLFSQRKTPLETNIVTAIADPYATPVTDQRVILKGQLSGSLDDAGSLIALEDNTGIIPVRYTSRFGPMGNFWTKLKPLRPFLGSEVTVRGWIRRGITSHLDLDEILLPRKLKSFPQTWLWIWGGSLVVIGILLFVVGPTSRFYFRELPWSNVQPFN
jgi:Zn-dependent protease with chaperone function